MRADVSDLKDKNLRSDTSPELAGKNKNARELTTARILHILLGVFTGEDL